MSNTDTILINGLEFYAYHGASDQEQEVGHRYLVDVSLEIDAYPAGISDKLSETVNYSKVAKRIVQIGVGEQFRLLEALAHKISTELFLEFPQIEGMRLRVQKMCPPMNVIAHSVGVEIFRRRNLATVLTPEV